MKPVVDKIATIVSEKTSSNNIEELVLVGGSSCLTGIEEAIEKEIGIRTTKPDNPLFVTPLGIALSCTDEALN